MVIRMCSRIYDDLDKTGIVLYVAGMRLPLMFKYDSSRPSAYPKLSGAARSAKLLNYTRLDRHLPEKGLAIS